MCDWKWLTFNQNLIRNLLNSALGNLWLEIVNFESESNEKSAKFCLGQSGWKWSNLKQNLIKDVLTLALGNGQLFTRI